MFLVEIFMNATLVRRLEVVSLGNFFTLQKGCFMYENVFFGGEIRFIFQLLGGIREVAA